ncbi:AAA family ATPase [Pleomorphovibrio marinus]|uniref:AAA family ATPase n=1 Tax=Pleomorphovibrio marinus TaxID=2164132 RepID=UPI000E0C4F9D|nr:MoxR family ATPase [Pleomorphovibrio marinus]
MNEESQANPEPNQNSGDGQFESRLPLKELNRAMNLVLQELKKIIVGQDEMMELLMVGLLAKGHILIEGVPGVAKTITAKIFAKTLQTQFSRIQFTPDLMPSDVLGTSVFDRKSSSFEFRKGPVFSNVILIDEINRSPAKTQSALFEVMEERQVTLEGQKYEMENPFMVLATQNPIEQEGTYALPEAQLDRFLFKIDVGYPTLDEEVLILEGHHGRGHRDVLGKINGVISPEEIREFQDLSARVLVEKDLMHYIASLITKTRNHPHLFLGASPRASLAIMRAAQGFAAIDSRDFIIPEDIKRAAKPVLRHRIILTPEREMEGMTTESVIEAILESVPVPR